VEKTHGTRKQLVNVVLNAEVLNKEDAISNNLSIIALEMLERKRSELKDVFSVIFI
jgi:hypothetical protein